MIGKICERDEETELAAQSPLREIEEKRRDARARMPARPKGEREIGLMQSQHQHADALIVLILGIDRPFEGEYRRCCLDGEHLVAADETDQLARKGETCDKALPVGKIQALAHHAFLDPVKVMGRVTGREKDAILRKDPASA